MQHLPASVSDVGEVRSLTLNAVPPRDGLKCHFGHKRGEGERGGGKRGGGERWEGGGREQVSTSVLVKPFTVFALSHMCYFTLWHRLLEVFRPEMFLKAVLSLNNTISSPMYQKPKAKPKITISFTTLFTRVRQQEKISTTENIRKSLWNVDLATECATLTREELQNNNAR